MTEKVECLIEHCSLLFPVRAGEGEERSEDTALAIADGKIVAVGNSNDLRSRYQANCHHDARGGLLTPGFVDSHTHLVFAGDRSSEYLLRCSGASYEEIAAAGGGIRASVRHTRGASEEELYELALPRVLRMVRQGTTTIEIKSGYGLETETELRMLRVIRRLSETLSVRIVATFLGAHETPDEYREDRAGYLSLVCEEMIPAVAEQGLARFCDVFCETDVFTPEESRTVLETGQRFGLTPKVHADELAASGGSRVAAEVGAVSADHLMMTDADGIAALDKAAVVATLLPGTTFYLNKKKYAPARRFLDAGLTVALATDRNPGSCTVESMQFILGLACQHLQMTPEEAFRAATESGARALGLDDQVGTIAPGQAADLILWQVENAAQIVYEYVNDLPRTVFVAGEALKLEEYA